MTKHDVITPSELVYGGVSIREKGEMLSLTDMWKAAGSPENRDPKFWARQDGVQSFVEVLAAAENVTVDHLFRATRGRNGATYAHWQVAMGYAKYLSPEFHMWCNSVVRSHMEGEKMPGVPVETLEQIERSFGIMRMLAAKITHIEQSIPAIVEATASQAISAKLAESNIFTRRGLTAKCLWDRHNLPPKLRGSTNWLGNRLCEMGCMTSKADRGNGSIRLFDPDLAEACMKNGLLHKARVYSSERMGQGKLKLIGGAK